MTAWRSSRGYVEDVAAAIALAATDARAAGHLYNVGEGDAHCEADWVKRIAEVTGWTGQVVAVPDALTPDHLQLPFDFAQHWWTDSRKSPGDGG